MNVQFVPASQIRNIYIVQNNLLKKYIAALISEAIPRSALKPKASSKSGDTHTREQFKLEEFKRLKSLKEMQVYANSKLQILGEGSARSVYRLGGTKVLKVAKDEKGGIAQNHSELDIFTNPKTSAITTKIFDSDSSFRWIISEVVKPFSKNQADSDFQSATGIPWDDFSEILSYTKQIPESWSLEPDQYALINGALSVINTGNLAAPDVAVKDHWGLTADGRVVLLDYGFTLTQAMQNSTETQKVSDKEQFDFSDF